MDMHWEGEHECAWEDDDFEDYKPQSIPNAVHELYRGYGYLIMIDLSSIGMTYLFMRISLQKIIMMQILATNRLLVKMLA